ncbi:MAG: HAMP domain-containing histidine kinase [Clostridia bacterium]|nr:HAMP domain-containing histidine kinase [Clostridia bacterium]
MTIKRKWQITLVLVAVLAILLNTLLLNFYIERNFNDYVKSSYDNNVTEIIDYVKTAMSGEGYNLLQMNVELKTHLDEPISEIAIYDENNISILTVGIDFETMGSDMMNRMMKSTQQVDEYIINEENMKATILITRNSDLRDTSVSINFKRQLIKNGFLSVFLVIIISIFIAFHVSKNVSRDLIETAKMANQINLEHGTTVNISSKINEINTINDSLKNLHYRLMLKRKGRKEKIDALVHQTRTPLMILKSTVEGIRSHVFTLDQTRLEIMDNQIENMESIIKNMSHLIDVEEQSINIDIITIDLKSELKQIISGLSTAMSYKNIDIELRYFGNSHIRTDKYLLKQAVYNILSNAYTYTSNMGKIVMTANVSKDYSMIEIQDTGIGIPGDQHERIFDAYYKVDDKSVQNEGLGLYIAKQNIEHLGGKLTVKSVTGEGSIFTIILYEVHQKE